MRPQANRAPAASRPPRRCCGRCPVADGNGRCHRATGAAPVTRKPRASIRSRSAAWPARSGAWRTTSVPRAGSIRSTRAPSNPSMPSQSRTAHHSGQSSPSTVNSTNGASAGGSCDDRHSAKPPRPSPTQARPTARMRGNNPDARRERGWLRMPVDTTRAPERRHGCARCAPFLFPTGSSLRAFVAIRGHSQRFRSLAPSLLQGDRPPLPCERHRT